MKKILFVSLFLVLYQSFYALTIQQVSISPSTGSNINLNLKVSEGHMFAYHDFAYTIEDNVITLTVCYDPITIPSITSVENDFILEHVNIGTENYSLVIVTNYRRLVDGNMICDSGNFSDTATFNFSAPLTQNITLSSNDLDYTKPDFKLFPNPTNGLLELQDYNTEIHAIKVYDNLGKLVKIFDTIDNKVLDLADLENGIYSIVLYTKSSKHTKNILLKK